MKKLILTIFCIFFIFSINSYAKKQHHSDLPHGFVYVSDIDPTIIQSMRYSTDQNFFCRVIPGYSVSTQAVATKKAAIQLKKVNRYMKKHGYKIVIYDAYRPQMSVDALKKWESDLSDIECKKYYYPTLSKSDLFNGQYIAKQSSHTRGSTFDVSIIKSDQTIKQLKYSTRTLPNGELIPFLDDNTVDMCSSFDLFHEVSHSETSLATGECLKMRLFLQKAMRKYGFNKYTVEWWHYTLKKEPFPDTYFNFLVK